MKSNLNVNKSVGYKTHTVTSDPGNNYYCVDASIYGNSWFGVNHGYIRDHNFRLELKRLIVQEQYDPSERGHELVEIPLKYWKIVALT